MCFETSRRGTVGGTASWRDNGRARESTGSLEAGRCVRPGKRIAQRGRHTAAVAHKRERRTQTLRPRQQRLRAAAARAGGPPAQASGNSFSVLLYLHSHGPRAGHSLLIESRGYSGNHRAAQPTVAGELVAVRIAPAKNAVSSAGEQSNQEKESTNDIWRKIQQAGRLYCFVCCRNTSRYVN